MLLRESRVIHLEFLKDVKLQQMPESQQETLLYHLKQLSFLEVRLFSRRPRPTQQIARALRVFLPHFVVNVASFNESVGTR